MIKEFNIFTTSLLLQMQCPHCKQRISYLVKRVPSPRWDGGETMATTENQTEEDFCCPYCSHLYEINLKNSECGGMVWVLDSQYSNAVNNFNIEEYFGLDVPRLPIVRQLTQYTYGNDKWRIKNDIALDIIAKDLGIHIAHNYHKRKGDGVLFEFDGLSEEALIIFECKMIHSVESIKMLPVSYYHLKKTIKQYSEVVDRKWTLFFVLVVDKMILNFAQHYCDELATKTSDTTFRIIPEEEINIRMPKLGIYTES